MKNVLILMTSVVTVMACNSDKGPVEDTSVEDTGPVDSPVTDDDGDGWSTEDGDCDDGNPDVNPDAEEECNGQDDNCNDEIDEGLETSTWYEDADGDGFGNPDTEFTTCESVSGYVSVGEDCDDSNPDVYPGADEGWYDGVDQDCNGAEDPDVCEEVPPDTTTDFDKTCTFDPAIPTDWDIQVEWSTDDWSYTDGSAYTRVMMTPVIGQLTDDNGDGVIDEGDIPDIAFNTFSGGSYSSAGYLRVLSGDGSAEHFSLNSVTDPDTGTSHSIASSGGIALGDIDADGTADILTITSNAFLIALEHDGTFKWVSEGSIGNQYSYPTIADMDGDGQAETIVGEFIFDSTGNLVGTAANSGKDHAFAADLDNDGVMEHIGGSGVSAMDGTVIWQSTSVGEGYPAVADWDLDGEGEVLQQISGVFTVFDTDGTVLLSKSLDSTGYNGAPCIGDLDGDGEPEAVVAGSYYIVAMDNDGTIMWQNSSSDTSSGGTACTIWDFNGDGIWEVLHADHNDLNIWDGATGALLFNEPNHASGTIREQPVMADVDRDGSTEIVFANNNYAYSGYDGVYVLGEVNDEWVSTRTVWNQGPFWSGNINEDMSVPTDAEMPWELANNFRSQMSITANPTASQDYKARILGMCEDKDDPAGALEVWVTVENAGAVFGLDGIDVALYADNGGTWTLLGVQQTTDTIDAGQVLAPMSFTIDPSDLGSNGLVAVADDDGTGQGSRRECIEDNNSDGWGDPAGE